MLNFFSKSKYISDYVPTEYTDIHSHIMHNIDDGAKNPEDSALLINTLLEIGTKNIISTPHTSTHIWNNSPEIIVKKREELNNIIPDLLTKSNFKVASEYLLDDSFLTLLENKQVLTYKDNHILVEFSYFNVPLNYQNIFFEIQLNGYQPILAHPERYSYFNNHPEVFEAIRKSGVKLQLNLLSLVGYYGPDVMKMADELLKRNLYDFTGSDLHHKMHCKALHDKIKLKHHSGLSSVMANNYYLLK
ncbi:histidinol phosphatase [Flavobacterium agricola]|uniref:protein-tyrosine-phosphatase n=1 Tax=Flavobacterium agricola TaxID=2870839 RepID=A0ABY6LZC8_9FLAO|nr:CpsB/CapC family capsule biosynthesis tyrosine phosphatase [Flavobacterium agricola]UYW00520.1 histidinol phosphatase [Flavobacterium agricola]